MTEQTSVPAPPSSRALGRAIAVALVVATVVLVTTVLPAEFGIDPLGTGEALGLSGLSGGVPAAVTVPVAPAAGGPLKPSVASLKADTTEFALLPYVGFVEYHYRLAEGDAMVYAWTATGKLQVDFHTQPDGKPPDASETFEKGESDSGKGSFTAPYDGLHGWYWENRTDQVVRITVSTSGFYTEAIEYKDNGTSVQHELKADPVSP